MAPRSCPSHQVKVVRPLPSLRVSHAVGETRAVVLLSEVSSANRASNDSLCRWIRMPPGNFAISSSRSRLLAMVLASASQGFSGSLLSTLAGAAGR